MKSTLVDSSVLLDIATEDPKWLAWSSEALASAANESRIYFPTIELIAPLESLKNKKP